MTAEIPLLIVRDLKALDGAAHGRPFTSMLVLKKLASKTASNGNAFFSIELGDRTGSFSCTIFNDSPSFEAIKTAGEGAVLRIEGEGHGLEIVDEEAFGPVLTVHVYDQFKDALRMANATRYGLQAGLFTDSLARVKDAYDRLDVGALVVGDVPSVRVDAMPYGGRRDSGIGREGVRYAIEEMTDRKLLVMRG